MKHQVKNEKDIKRLPRVFSIDLSKLQFAEDGTPPAEIQVLPTGKWNHPAYGPIIIEASDITEFKSNFDKGLRRDIPITEGHETFDEKPAIGWFKEMHDRGVEGLFATVEWTKQGKTLLAERSYKYFSPEFYSEYEDPETREIHSNVLVGGAVTNKPYFKELKAVVLSEHSAKNGTYQFSDNENNKTMELKDIVTKKVEELSTEEKTFINEHKAELTTEQLATFGSVLEDAGAAGDNGAGDNGGDNKDDKGNGGENKNDADGKGEGEGKGNEGGEGGQQNASEKNTVTIPAGEFKALSEMANKGAKAFAELRETKIKNETSALVFSEQNSTGKILPKDEQKVFSFMLGLTDAQRKTFAEIVKEIPSSKLFGETGSGNDIKEGSAAAQLQAKVEKLMSEDKAMTYSDALKKVLASDKDLAKRYDAENKPGNK